MRSLALASCLLWLGLACAGVELFPDAEVRDASLEEARAQFRVPDGASHIDGLARTSLDVESVQVCFDATPALIEAQRAEAMRKGATRVSDVAPPPNWPDFPGMLDWHPRDWWPTEAEEVWRWEQGAGNSDMGYGAMWTLDGDRACVWTWHLQFWTP